MQISVAPPAISAAFFDAIRRLKDLNFMWKWDGELPKDLPSNIFMRTWMPQQDILGWSSLIVFQMPYQIFLKLIKCITHSSYCICSILNTKYNMYFSSSKNSRFYDSFWTYEYVKVSVYNTFSSNVNDYLNKV